MTSIDIRTGSAYVKQNIVVASKSRNRCSHHFSTYFLCTADQNILLGFSTRGSRLLMSINVSFRENENWKSSLTFTCCTLDYPAVTESCTGVVSKTSHYRLLSVKQLKHREACIVQ